MTTKETIREMLLALVADDQVQAQATFADALRDKAQVHLGLKESDETSTIKDLIGLYHDLAEGDSMGEEIDDDAIRGFFDNCEDRQFTKAQRKFWAANKAKVVKAILDDQR